MATLALLPTPDQDPDTAAWVRESQAYLGTVEAAGKSPNTVATYGHSLDAWATWRRAQALPLDPVRATRREAQAWVSWMARKGPDGSPVMSPNTAATRFSNVARFFRWMVQEWALSGESRPSPFDHVKGATAVEPRVPVLPPDAMDRLLGACRGTAYVDLRDRAMLALMVSAGLRRSEVASLLVEDVDPVGRLVRVRGKGDRVDVVPFGQVAADALRVYLRARARHRDAHQEYTVPGVRPDRPQWGRPLFLVHPRGAYGPISGYTVAQALEKRCAMAGLPRVHPHQLRHTFAHELMAAGVEERDVMTLGRWKSRRVMDRYGADLREARAAAPYVDPLARGRDRRPR